MVLLSSLLKKNPIAAVSNRWTQEFDNHPHIDGIVPMPLRVIRITRDIALLVVFAGISHSQIYGQIEKQTLNALFIGNSYTGRHNLSEVVETLAEEGNPQVDFEPIAFIYGGRNLYNHWNLGTQNIVRINSLTEAEQQATIARIEEMLARDPDWTHGKAALRRHQELLGNLDDRRVEWDLVVLQSWRDDLEGCVAIRRIRPEICFNLQRRRRPGSALRYDSQHAKRRATSRQTRFGTYHGKSPNNCSIG